jgi:hypothetical protein
MSTYSGSFSRAQDNPTLTPTFFNFKDVLNKLSKIDMNFQHDKPTEQQEE